MPEDDAGLGIGEGIFLLLESYENDIQNFSTLFESIQSDASAVLDQWVGQEQNDSWKSTSTNDADIYPFPTFDDSGWSTNTNSDDSGWLRNSSPSTDDAWMNDPSTLNPAIDIPLVERPNGVILGQPAGYLLVQPFLDRLTALQADVQGKKTGLESLLNLAASPDVQTSPTGQAGTDNQNDKKSQLPGLPSALLGQPSGDQSKQYQALLEGYGILAALHAQIAQIPPEVEGVSFQPVIQSATEFAHEYASALKAAAGGGGNGFFEAILTLLLKVLVLLLFIERWLSLIEQLFFAKDNKSNKKQNNPKGNSESDTQKYTPDNPPRPNESNPKSMLPVGGEHPYKPKKVKGGKPDDVTPNPKGKGYVDEDGNIWEWDPSGHTGPHWDVQHPDGTHTNVYPDGDVHQGKDYF